MVEAALEPVVCEACGEEISSEEPGVVLRHNPTRTFLCFHGRCALVAYRAATVMPFEWTFWYHRRGGQEARSKVI